MSIKTFGWGNVAIIAIASVMMVGAATTAIVMVTAAVPYNEARAALGSSLSKSSLVAAQGAKLPSGDRAVVALHTVVASCSALDTNNQSSVKDMNDCAKTVTAATAAVQHELDTVKS